ncbi:MAG: RHS repeat-associated core domain-containing protein [Chloroflexota bacterium]
MSINGSLVKKINQILTLILCSAMLIGSSPVIAGPELDVARHVQRSQQADADSLALETPTEELAAADPNDAALAAPDDLATTGSSALSASIDDPLSSLADGNPFASTSAEPASALLNAPLYQIPDEILPPSATGFVMRKRGKFVPGLASLLPAATILLDEGWHLISIPEELGTTDPATVLASIAGSFSQVWAYDGCDAAAPWKLYDPNDAAASDLTAITPAMGLWINMTASDVLEVAGTALTGIEIPICTGWNLIGYPVSDSFPVAGALSSIDGQYSLVFGWENADLQDPWSVFEPATPTWGNDLNLMQAGNGYWVLATADTTLTLGSPAQGVAVELTSPAEADEITKPISVTGVITGDTTLSWSLDYREEGESEWNSFASGQSSSGSVAGTFDPTLLQNGLYELRINAEDLFGQSNEEIIDVIIEGGMKIGHFSISYIDLAVPVAGIPISIIRSYDSRNKRGRDFGIGWELDIKTGTYKNNRKPGDGWVIRGGSGPFGLPCQVVEETKFHVTEIRFSDVEFYRFKTVVTPTGPLAGSCEAIITYEQIDGIPGATLVPFGNEFVYYRSGSDQMYDAFDSNEIYEPENVTLITLDGREFEFSLNDGLTRIDDPNGNYLVINDSGITHSTGESISFDRDTQNRIELITDPAGHTLSYEYDAAGDLVRMTNRTNDATEYEYVNNHYLSKIVNALGISAARLEYDNDGRLIAVVDPNGNRTEMTHDLAGRQEIIRNSKGHPTIYTYDDEGQILRIETTVTSEGTVVPVVQEYEYDADGNEVAFIDPDGVRTEMSYDTNQQLLGQVLDPAGLALTSSIDYDARGYITSHEDAAGGITSYAYDATGNLTNFSDPDGVGHTLGYGGSGLPISHVDSDGSVATAGYDARGWMNSREERDSDGTLLQRSEHTYDANGNELTVTEYRTIDGTVEALTQELTYNANGQVLSAVDAVGNTMTIEYNAMGLMSAQTDRLGNRTTYEYTDLAQLYRTTFADGTTELREYDVSGNLSRRVTRARVEITFEYDELNRLVKKNLPMGITEETVYSPGGRIVAETDAEGNRSEHSYDTAGRLQSITLPQVFDVDSGSMVAPSYTYEYNGVGRTTARIEPNNVRTEFEYSLAGRLNRIRFPDGTIREIGYNPAGQRSYDIDEELRRTDYAYDGLGRLIEVQLPQPNLTSARPTYRYTYDEAGNVLTQVDALNRTTQFRYDELSRVVERILPDGQRERYDYSPVGTLLGHTDFNGERFTFEYDSWGQLTTKILPDGARTTYTYTPIGQLETVTDNRGTIQYSYDALGRPASITQPTGETITYTFNRENKVSSISVPGGTLSYQYNALGELSQVTGLGSTVGYLYDAGGDLRQIISGDGTITDIDYNDRHWVTSVEHRAAGGTPLASFDYSYTPAGQRDLVTELTGDQVDYSYDGMGRLIGESRTGVNAYTIDYEYDLVSNRTRMVRNGIETLYTYDVNDRLTAAGADVTFSYDDNGNTTRITAGSTIYDYAYDYENRLIGITSPTDAASFRYDAEGQLIGQTTAAGERNFLVDKLNPTGYSQILEERDENGLLLTSYGYGRDLLAAQSGTDTTHFHHDAQASMRLTTENGVVASNFTYDGYGVPVSSSGVPSAYGYTGERNVDSPGSDLLHLRARFYMPETGRFLVQDPFWGLREQPMTLNKYMYTHGDPVNLIDPSGQLVASIASAYNAAKGYIARASSAVQAGAKVLCQSKAIRGIADALEFMQEMGAIFATNIDFANLSQGWDKTASLKVGAELKVEWKSPFASEGFASEFPLVAKDGQALKSAKLSIAGEFSTSENSKPHAWLGLSALNQPLSLDYLSYNIAGELESFAGSKLSFSYSLPEGVPNLEGELVLYKDNAWEVCDTLPIVDLALVAKGSTSNGFVSIASKWTLVKILKFDYTLLKFGTGGLQLNANQVY